MLAKLAAQTGIVSEERLLEIARTSYLRYHYHISCLSYHCPTWGIIMIDFHWFQPQQRDCISRKCCFKTLKITVHRNVNKCSYHVTEFHVYYDNLSVPSENISITVQHKDHCFKWLWSLQMLWYLNTYPNVTFKCVQCGYVNCLILAQFSSLLTRFFTGLYSSFLPCLYIFFRKCGLVLSRVGFN